MTLAASCGYLLDWGATKYWDLSPDTAAALAAFGVGFIGNLIHTQTHSSSLTLTQNDREYI